LCVHYFLVEYFKNSNLEVFTYENPCMFIH
jgi:hypothetical protein